MKSGSAFLSSATRLCLLLSTLGMSAASLLPMDAQAADPCTGHKMLQTRRSELSCSQLKLQIYPSPDRTLRAIVYPTDISLDVTPDMESRLVIRTSKGETLISKDYSSPRGFNGFYIVDAKWSADSKFFVYSMSSSGGYSPWQFPMAVYGREAVRGSEKHRIVEFSELMRRDGPKMGKRLAKRDVKPDLILSSPARRALTTAEIIAKKLDYKLKNIVVDDRLYAGTAHGLLDVIHKLGDKLKRVMLFGHDPELTELVHRLSSEITHMPTCAVAEFTFDAEGYWRRLFAASAHGSKWHEWVG